MSASHRCLLLAAGILSRWAKGMTSPRPLPPAGPNCIHELRLREAHVEETVRNICGEDSTGRKIWDAGRALSNLLSSGSSSSSSLNALSLTGRRILELGSGTGVVGLTAAANGAASVYLTDGAESVLPVLRANAKENDTEDKVRVMRLRWGDTEDIAKVAALGPFDWILGSDLLYSPESFPDLVDTLVALCTAPTQSDLKAEVFLAYPARHTEDIFFEQAGVVFEEMERDEIEPAVYLSRLVVRE